MSNWFNNVKLSLKKNAPSIALTTGTVGLVGTIALSNYQTTKAGYILEEHKKEIEELNEAARTVDEDRYSAEDYKKDNVIVLARTASKFAKHYALSIALGTASIGLIVYGRNAYEGRIASLTAAYTLTKEVLDRYRAKIAEDLGEEQEQGLYDSAMFDVKKAKNGKIAEVEVPDRVLGRFFDEGETTEYNANPSSNQIFVRHQENFFNEKLSKRGYVFLNEVYEGLGFRPTPEGQVMGWFCKPGEDHPRISFFHENSLSNSDILTKAVVEEKVSPAALWLDFNVDGVIYDKLEG